MRFIAAFLTIVLGAAGLAILLAPLVDAQNPRNGWLPCPL
jgi:hypothetical protein